MSNGNPVPGWDPAWDPDTLADIYAEALRTPGQLTEWSDALDAKAVAIFGVTSAIVAVGPSLLGEERSTTSTALLILAAILWMAAFFYCFQAYNPRRLTMGPNPQKLLDPRWLGIHQYYFRLYRIRELGAVWDRSTATIDDKAHHLKCALLFGGLEVAALVLAVLFA